MVLSKSKTSFVRKQESVVPKFERLRIGKLDHNCWKLDVRSAKIFKLPLYEIWSQLYQNPKVYIQGNWMVWQKPKTVLVRKLESDVPKFERLRIGKLDRNCRKLDVRSTKILHLHCTKLGASCTKIRKFTYREIGWFGRNPKPFLFENWSQMYMYQNSKGYVLGNWIVIVGNWTYILPKSYTYIVANWEPVVPKSESLHIGKLDGLVRIQNFSCSKVGVSCTKV